MMTGHYVYVIMSKVVRDVLIFSVNKEKWSEGLWIPVIR